MNSCPITQWDRCIERWSNPTLYPAAICGRDMKIWPDFGRGRGWIWYSVQPYFYPRAMEVSVSMYGTIVLAGAMCQLDDVSVCCEVSVGLVQGCEWLWQIFGEALYGTSFLSDNSMQFLQSPSKSCNLIKCLTGQVSTQITSACLASVRGKVPPGCAKSPTALNVLDFTKSPVSTAFKHQHFKCHQCHRLWRMPSNLLACPKNLPQSMRSSE